MTFPRDKIKYLILIGIILAWVLFVIIPSIKDKEKLLKKHNLTTAVIFDWNHDSKSGYWLDYEYFVNSVRYEHSTKDQELSREKIKSLIGKSFPLVYFPGDPDNSQLLYRPIDFNEYNIIPPDSLFK